MTDARRALVTGATGFIGSHLVHRLVADGWEVHALVRAPFGRVPAGVTEHEVPQHPEDLVGVVGDVAPNVCFHLATRFQATHAPADVAGLVAANVGFGATVVEAVTATTRCPFVNVGTVWQHFEGSASPTTLYAATKQAFEDVLGFYRDVEMLPAATLELSDTYGPCDQRPKLVPLLLAAARDGTTLELSPGEQLVDLVHVDDVVRALLAVAAAMLDGRVVSGTFAARSGLPVTVRRLVGLVELATGRALDVRWGARPYRAREMFTPWPSAPPPPGWAASVPLADGLAALVSQS